MPKKKTFEESSQKIDEITNEIIDDLEKEKNLPEIIEKNNEKEAPLDFSKLFGDSDNKDFQQKIVDELLNDNNIDKKTDLNKPVQFAVLTVISDVLEERKLPKSNCILNNFINRVYRLKLSENRKSRAEYIEALKNLKDKDELEKKQNLLGIK